MIELDLTVENGSDATIYAGEASILAAFRISPRPRLVDALDMKSDRFTGFREKSAVLQIGRNQDAVFVVNNHSNSSQDYDILTAFLINQDRLEPMFDLFIFNSHGCGVGFEEIATFSSLPSEFFA